MRFFVILTIDIPRSESITDYNPPKNVRRKMQLTEDDDSYEYSYLGGEWEKGKHRKWVGELSRKDFEALIHECDIAAEDVETMGSLTGFGWLPAMSFRGDHYMGFVNAYVTPIPEIEPRKVNKDDPKEVEAAVMRADRDWNRITKAMLSLYR